MNNPPNHKSRDLELIYTRKAKRYQCEVSQVFVKEWRAIFDALIPSTLDLRVFDRNPLLKRQTIIDGIVVIGQSNIDEMHQLVVDFVNINTLFPHLTQNSSTTSLIEFIELSSLIFRIVIAQPGTPLLHKFMIEYMPFLYQLCYPTAELHSFTLAFTQLLTQIIITGHFTTILRLQALNLLSSLLTDFNALFRDIPMIGRLLENDQQQQQQQRQNQAQHPHSTKSHLNTNHLNTIDESPQHNSSGDNNNLDDDPRKIVYNDLLTQRELLLPLYDTLIRPLIQPLFFTIPLTFDLQLLLPLVSLCMKLLGMFYVLETLPGDGVMFSEGFLYWLFPLLRLHMILDPAVHDEIYKDVSSSEPTTLIELIERFNGMMMKKNGGGNDHLTKNNNKKNNNPHHSPPPQPPHPSHPIKTLTRILTTNPNFASITELALNALQLGFSRTSARIYAKSLASISGDPNFVQFSPFLIDVSYINNDCQSPGLEHIFCSDPDFEVIENVLQSTLCLSLLPHIIKSAIQLRHKFLTFLDIELHLFYQISYDEWYEIDGQFEFIQQYHYQCQMEQYYNNTTHLGNPNNSFNLNSHNNHILTTTTTTTTPDSWLVDNNNSQHSSYQQTQYSYPNTTFHQQHYYPSLPPDIVNEPPILSETISTFLLQVDQFYTNTDDTMALLLDIFKFTHHNMIQQYPFCSLSMISTRLGDLPPSIVRGQQEFLQQQMKRNHDGNTSAKQTSTKNTTDPIFIDAMPQDLIDDWTQSAFQNRPGLILFSQSTHQLFLYQPRVVPFSYFYHHHSSPNQTTLPSSSLIPSPFQQATITTTPQPIDFTHATNPELSPLKPLMSTVAKMVKDNDCNDDIDSTIGYQSYTDMPSSHHVHNNSITAQKNNPLLSIIFQCDHGFPAPHSTFLAYYQYCYETITASLFDTDHLMELHRTSHPPLAVIRSIVSTSLQVQHNSSHLKPLNQNNINQSASQDNITDTHPNLDLTTLQLKPKYPRIFQPDNTTLSLDPLSTNPLQSLTYTFFPHLNPSPQVQRPPEHLLSRDHFRAYSYIPSLEQKLFALVSKLDYIANDCLPRDSECGLALREQLEGSYHRGGIIAQFDQQLISYKYEPLQAQYPLYHPQRDQFWQNEITNLIIYCEQFIVNFTKVFGPIEKINHATFSMNHNELLLEFQLLFNQLLNAINTFQCLVLQTNYMTTWCDIALDLYSVYIPPFISTDGCVTTSPSNHTSSSHHLRTNKSNNNPLESLEAAMSSQFIKSQSLKDRSRNKSVTRKKGLLDDNNPQDNINNPSVNFKKSSFAKSQQHHHSPSQQSQIHIQNTQSSQHHDRSNLKSYQQRSQQRSLYNKHAPSASSKLVKSVAAKGSPQQSQSSKNKPNSKSNHHNASHTEPHDENYDDETGEIIYTHSSSNKTGNNIHRQLVDDNHNINENNNNNKEDFTPTHDENALECLIFSPFTTFSIQIPSYLSLKTLPININRDQIDQIGVWNAVQHPQEDLPQQIYNIKPFSYLQYLSKKTPNDFNSNNNSPTHQNQFIPNSSTTYNSNNSPHRNSSTTLLSSPLKLTTSIAEISQFSSSPTNLNIIPSAGVLYHIIRRTLPLLRVLDLRFYPATVLDAESLNCTLFNPDDSLLIDNIYFYNWFVVGPTAKQNGGYLDRLLYRLGLQIIGLARPNDRVDTIGMRLLIDFVEAQKRQFVLNYWNNVIIRRYPLSIKLDIVHYLELQMNKIKQNDETHNVLALSKCNSRDSGCIDFQLNNGNHHYNYPINEHHHGNVIPMNSNNNSYSNQLVLFDGQSNNNLSYSLSNPISSSQQSSNNNKPNHMMMIHPGNTSNSNNSNDSSYLTHKNSNDTRITQYNNTKHINPDTFANLRNLKEQSDFNNPALPHVVIGQTKLEIFEMPASFWDPAEHNILSQPTSQDNDLTNDSRNSIVDLCDIDYHESLTDPKLANSSTNDLFSIAETNSLAKRSHQFKDDRAIVQLPPPIVQKHQSKDDELISKTSTVPQVTKVSRGSSPSQTSSASPSSSSPTQFDDNNDQYQDEIEEENTNNNNIQSLTGKRKLHYTPHISSPIPLLPTPKELENMAMLAHSSSAVGSITPSTITKNRPLNSLTHHDDHNNNKNNNNIAAQLNLLQSLVKTSNDFSEIRKSIVTELGLSELNLEEDEEGEEQSDDDDNENVNSNLNTTASRPPSNTLNPSTSLVKTEHPYRRRESNGSGKQLDPTTHKLVNVVLDRVAQYQMEMLKLMNQVQQQIATPHHNNNHLQTFFPITHQQHSDGNTQNHYYYDQRQNQTFNLQTKTFNITPSLDLLNDLGARFLEDRDQKLTTVQVGRLLDHLMRLELESTQFILDLCGHFFDITDDSPLDTTHENDHHDGFNLAKGKVNHTTQQ